MHSIGFIDQPFNAFSCLFYVFIGLYIAVKLSRPLFGLMIALFGICGFIYHANPTLTTQCYDLGAVLLFTSYLLTVNIHTLYYISIREKHFQKWDEPDRVIFAILVAGSFLLFLVGQYLLDMNIGAVLIGISILAIYYTGRRIQPLLSCDMMPLNLCIKWLAVAFVFWICDFQKGFCCHWVWHIVSGYAMIPLAKYFKQYK